jgi:ribose transport system substrate-binding protein
MKRLFTSVLGFALWSAAAIAGTPHTIAFSLKTVTNDDFQKAIATSIQEAVEKSGNKFLLVTAGEETGVSTQVNQLEDLIAKKVDAIVVSPMDAKSVVPVLKKAQAAQIPVIVVDSSVEKGNEGLYISYVGTDNFNAGKVAGQRMVKELGGAGNVLIVRGANGSLAGDQRVDGFKAGVQGSGLKIVGEQPGNWTNSVAMQVTENMLQANKKIDGLFSASDVMLDGVLQAIGDADRSGVKILSVDGSKKAVDLVEQGAIVGTMAQFPVKMGSIAVEDLLEVLDGKKAADAFPKVIDSGTMVYDKTNLSEARKWAF